MRRILSWCVPSVALVGLGCQPTGPSTTPPEPSTVAPAPEITTSKSEAPPPPTTASPVLAEATEPGKTTKTASGLTYSTIKPGDGKPVAPGDEVRLKARGTFEDGKSFLDTEKAGQPWSFVLGDPDVVLGVNEGVAGMKPGEVRKLILPPQIGYGALGTFAGTPKEGQPVIPPNSTLIYEVELLKP